MSEDFSALGNFGGTARLFPLPNLVLFPQVMQPLHIFEPRYRQMTEEALATDRLIALVLLRAGWEEDYAGAPDLHPVACLGKIVAEQRLDDGRFNILLRGLSRIRIIEEVSTGKLFRAARVELLDDRNLPGPNIDRRLRRKLARKVPTWFAKHGAALEQVRKLLKSEQPLGALCDILSFALPLEVEAKQDLLATLDVEKRARRLLDEMEAAKAAAGSGKSTAERKFPPDFSDN
jgi:Lon protease-like protein